MFIYMFFSYIDRPGMNLNPRKYTVWQRINGVSIHLADRVLLLLAEVAKQKRIPSQYKRSEECAWGVELS